MSKGSVLKDMGVYKEKLTDIFISSDEICELLLDSNSYTYEDTEELLYKQIFPYLYIDEDNTNILPYLCFEADISKIPDRNIKDMSLTIWVYCHKDCMVYNKDGYCGTKVDILADMIERNLRNFDNFGIGKLELQSVTNYSPNKNHFGKQIIYTVPDFKLKG